MSDGSPDISARYQREDEAARYARRQSLRGSPAEWLVGRLEIREVTRALRLLGVRQQGLVLDVAAGTGKLTPTLRARFGDYIASDLSAAMLSHVPGAPPRCQADATRLPFRAGSAAAAACLRLFHRLPPAIVSDCVAELLRVAPAGAVVSYGSTPGAAGLYRAGRRLAGRPTMPGLRPTSVAEFAAMVAAHGGVVLSDRSISYGLTSERIAAIRAG